MHENAGETKAVCNIDNVYQYYVLTLYILYTMNTRICKIRCRSVDFKGENKTKQIIGC